MDFRQGRLRSMFFSQLVEIVDQVFPHGEKPVEDGALSK
jgi:hypothetical protein